MSIALWTLQSRSKGLSGCMEKMPYWEQKNKESIITRAINTIHIMSISGLSVGVLLLKSDYCQRSYQ